MNEHTYESYSFHIGADLDAVVSALYAASEELLPIDLVSAGMPTGGTLTYGPWRSPVANEPRRGEERFDKWLELPETITRRMGDEPMPGASIYLGVRRVSDRRVKVRMLFSTAKQLSVIHRLVAQLEEDYPGIVDLLNHKMRDLPMPLTPLDRPPVPLAPVSATTQTATTTADVVPESVSLSSSSASRRPPSKLTVYVRWRETWLYIKSLIAKKKYDLPDLLTMIKNHRGDLVCSLKTLGKIRACGQCGLLDLDPRDFPI